jgi:hypothetical protein
MSLPGTRLRRVAARLFDAQTLERLIDPVIADLRREQADALRQGQPWRARAVRAAGYVAFVKVAAFAASRGSRLAVRDAARADDRAIGRTVLFSLAAMLAITAVFVVPPLSHSHDGHVGDLPRLIWYLLPQALAVSTPIGVVLGILMGLRGRTVTTRVRRTIAGLAILATIATIVNTGWVMPEGNQAFREFFAGRRILRGTNELTFGQLAATDMSQFHDRLSLACAPLALALFCLGVARIRRERYGAIVTALFGLTICFAYYVLMLDFRRHGAGDLLPAVVSAWLPNVAFLAAASLLRYVPSQTRGPFGADPSRRDDAPQSADPPVVPLA